MKYSDIILILENVHTIWDTPKWTRPKMHPILVSGRIRQTLTSSRILKAMLPDISPKAWRNMLTLSAS